MGTTRIHLPGRVRRFARVAAVLVSFATPAWGQSPSGSVSPQALISAWKSTPPRERDAVVDAIVARRTEMLQPLRETARSGKAADRFFACTMLAELRDRDGVEALVAATADADVRIRRRAATGLRVLGDRRAAGRMRELLRTDADDGVVKTALAALGTFGIKADRNRIEPFLAHGSETVRVTAAGALAMLGDESGLDTVLLSTRSFDPGTQKTATYALGLFADPRAGERLAEILADPEGAWKGYALAARANRDLRGQDAAKRVASLETLALNRDSRTLAEWAIEELGGIGTPAAQAALQRVAARDGAIGTRAARGARVLEQAR